MVMAVDRHARPTVHFRLEGSTPADAAELQVG
jgi:hypothetical protein